jgi:SAM-dependent methyltransferase
MASLTSSDESELAELYAAIHDGTPGDVDYYLAQAGTPTDVLELGCGAGRISLALLQAGHRVTGLDLDAQALALLRRRLATRPTRLRRNLTLVHGDMRDFQLTQRFARILIPYNALYCLEDDAQKIACLRQARAHLAEDGQVILDAYVIDEFHALSEPVEDDDGDDAPVASVSWRGQPHQVFESTRWDRDAQRLEVTYRFVPRDGNVNGTDDGGDTPSQVLFHHYLLTEQIEPLCRRAGLALVQTCGDFDGSPLTPSSPLMACVLEAR